MYQADGALMDHFSGVPAEALEDLECYEDGEVIPSLANVLQLRRPVVIVDEAHNARTELSFDTLARFSPSCILELTATPDLEANPSNVLFSVSAAELKAEEMIKLPIELTTSGDWKALLTDSIAQRDALEQAAREEREATGEYIRPIMLLQAEPNYSGRDSLDVETVKKTLIDDFNIPEEQIALSIGASDDLEGVDLLSPECPLRYVITVQKLKEGWDCPFAYVLCSVVALRSNVAIQQIVGRILRMPAAERKGHPALNKAYAFSASPHFHEALDAIKEVLIENGFERQETETLVRKAMAHGDRNGGGEGLPLFRYPGYDVRNTSGEVKEPSKTAPSKAGMRFDVPQLLIKQGDVFEPFEKTHVLEAPWKLSRCDANLPDFHPERDPARRGEVDIGEKGLLQMQFVHRNQRQMTLLADAHGWTEEGLVRWLDHAFPHQDIPPIETGAYLTRLVDHLRGERGLTLDALVHHKYALRNAVEDRVQEHRRDAHTRAYQSLLFESDAGAVAVDPEVCFSYSKDYPCSKYYNGNFVFNRHYYVQIGDMNGEEEACARFLDEFEPVEYWVRNLDRSRFSFWLQTASDRFYPDFVCRLRDGRILVVEYKGATRWSNQDSREKRRLGRLWMERSGGHCLFVMPKGKDWEAIRQVVSA